MEPKSVLVEYEDKENEKVYANSGVLFANQYVIITSNVLMPLINKQGSVKKILRCTHRSGFLTPNILLDTVPHLNVVFEEDLLHDDKRILYKTGIIIAMFINETIRNSSQKILHDWAIDCEENEHQSKEILALFFILKIQGSDTDFEHLKNCLYHVCFEAATSGIKVGKKIYVESTPFGNRHFLRSYSEGIISNITGDQCFLLSDAPTTPGSEGSPIFIKNRSDKKVTIGLVISSLSWWRGEWIGLTLGANIVTLTEPLIFPKICWTSVSEDPLRFKNVVDTMEKSVVQVVSGKCWGTAILLHTQRRMFLTNSHVIASDKVTLHWNASKIKAGVIFKTSATAANDLAVLIADETDFHRKQMRPAVASLRRLHTGEKVFAAGFPLFPSHFHPKPTLTSGHVSQVNSFMVKTTCPVLPGSSGGAILRPDGSLAAVIVCNAKIQENSLAYPRVNMAIPILAIHEIITEFLKTQDTAVLQKLQVENAHMHKEWNFLNGKL